MDSSFLSLREAAGLLSSGKTTSRALTQDALDRVEQHRALGAFLTVDAAGALAAADAADVRRKNGQSLGLLDGMVLAHKDILCTKGLRTTAASKILDTYVPPYSATVVDRWAAAGVVTLGKLNMDEFAMGSSTENSAYGPCRNPWDQARTPGGSSGGSSAAVAAGLCFGATGTDTGGSIRQPAALCGVVGIKPTYGRVSRYGCVAYASSLDQVGVFGRTVEDTALLLGALAGHDPKDSTSLQVPLPDFTSSLTGNVSGLRIGIPKEFMSLPGMDPAVRAAVDVALHQLEKLGAVLVDVSLPHTAHALPCYYVLAPAEASSNLARYDGIRFGPRKGDGGTLKDLYEQTRGELFGPEVKRRILLGTYVLSAGYYDAYYGRAQKVRALIKRDFDQAFTQVDVIAGPTTPTTAFKLGEKVNDPVSMYLSDVFTLSCNLAGLPGMSVPCGMVQNLPVGLQLLGKALDESTLFRVGHAYEQSTPWHTLHPPTAAATGAAATNVPSSS